ncbi:helix-turn-helix domain-containing protein [Paraburkholderia strydomiana]|uniref:Helix-turn-helix domain-containing protein n=1 Tax=Paraburkholderia strydomiana TaxID=1245417 RepID=A0ABW9CCD2_9BURK
MSGIQCANEKDVQRSTSPRPASPSRRRIAILLVDGCDLLGANVIAEAFTLASRLTCPDDSLGAYHVTFLSERGGAVRVASSLQVCTEAFEIHKDVGFDALFVAAPDQYVYSRSLEPSAQRLCHGRVNATQITYLCKDPSPPDGTPVTLRPDIDSRRSKVFDYALGAAVALIRRDRGDMLAQRVAQELSIVSRTVVSLALEETGTGPGGRVRIAARWLQDNCHRPISVGDAAAAAAMNGRSFARHFERELGVLPSDYLVDLRLQIARRLLVETDLTVDKIAEHSGMSSGVHLARTFRTHMKILPTEYRAFHRDGKSRRKRTAAAPALALLNDTSTGAPD